MITGILTALGFAIPMGHVLYNDYKETLSKKRSRHRYLKHIANPIDFAQIYYPCEICGKPVIELDWICNMGFCSKRCNYEFTVLPKEIRKIGKERIKERIKHSSKKRHRSTTVLPN